MHRDAAQVEPIERRQFCKGLAGMDERNTELVLCLAGGNFLMRFGIDIWVDAQTSLRFLSARSGQLCQFGSLFARFDVELADLLCSTLRTARLGLDLTAKAINLLGTSFNPSVKTRACRSNVARE